MAATSPTGPSEVGTMAEELPIQDRELLSLSVSTMRYGPAPGRPDQSRPDQAREWQTRAGQGRAGQGRGRHGRTDTPELGWARAAQRVAGQTRAGLGRCLAACLIVCSETAMDLKFCGKCQTS